MPKREDINKVLIIGSGPIIIGQACEFDYSGTQVCKALRSLGYKIVLVNSNPVTIMTDPGIADVTYIEPLNEYALTEIIKKERPDALLPNLGGQTGLNLSSLLAKKGVLKEYNVEVIGVNIDAIERGEDRIAFKETMTRLGIDMPRSKAKKRPVLIPAFLFILICDILRNLREILLLPQISQIFADLFNHTLIFFFRSFNSFSNPVIISTFLDISLSFSDISLSRSSTFLFRTSILLLSLLISSFNPAISRFSCAFSSSSFLIIGV
jgi:hypothetical protein